MTQSSQASVSVHTNTASSGSSRADCCTQSDASATRVACGDATDVAAVILAAGAGTRMKSRKPKVAHEVLGKPLVSWVIDAARSAHISDIVTVVGHLREQVIPLVEHSSRCAIQEERLGTANAVSCGIASLDAPYVLVLSGDCPLIESSTLLQLVHAAQSGNTVGSFLTMNCENPYGYGRVLHDDNACACRIVEEKDATDAQRAITCCNAGFYCFNTAWLRETLQGLTCDNAQGEWYLTDCVARAYEQHQAMVEVPCADIAQCSGINSRSQLANVTRLAQQRINARHMDAGVTFTDPTQAWIGPDVVLENDVEILPQTMLYGSCVVKQGSVIGPHTRLVDVCVGETCSVEETIAYESTIHDKASIGPRAYIRPGCTVCYGAKVGTCVEIKHTTVGKFSKVPHLSYLGDATVGEHVNIGAGSITCNYDGTHKYPTTIEDNVFVGSDTMMVAPVTLGAGSLIGAGSTITSDVSPDALALARARQVEYEKGALKYRHNE